jgi:hypothetical protein
MRFIRWVFLNVIFALLPLMASIALHSMAGRMPENLWLFSPELLFFALMTSVTALGDVIDIAGPVGWSPLILAGACTLGVCAVWSALMYGMHLYGGVFFPPDVIFQQSFSTWSVYVAVAAFILSFMVEAFISKVTEN